MKELEYYLDGEQNGFVALNENGKIISFKFANIRQELFKSIELLLGAIERKIESIKYNIAVALGYKTNNQKIISLSDLLKPIPDLYEYFDFKNDEVIMICVEPTNEKMIGSGYITFTDSPNERITDVSEGIEISKKCYKALLNVLAKEQRKGNMCKIETDYKHGAAVPYLTKRRIHRSTLNIRVMRGFELVKVNQFRKEFDLKAFPFDKNVDKYKNIYFVFSRDREEHMSDKVYRNIMRETLDNIKESLKIQYPDLLADYNIISEYNINV